ERGFAAAEQDIHRPYGADPVPDDSLVQRLFQRTEMVSQVPVHRAVAVTAISTIQAGSAKAETATDVQAGKGSEKYSARMADACRVSSGRVTETSTLSTSAMDRPCCSSRARILPNTWRH